MQIKYKGNTIEIERLPNGRYKKPNISQFVKSGRGSTWLDDCRIPYASDYDKSQATPQGKCTANSSAGSRPDAGEELERNEFDRPDLVGRFPSNLIVSDDVLGSIESVGAMAPVKSGQRGWGGEIYGKFNAGGDDGKSFYSDKETSKSFSRYFDLDKWAADKGVKDTFPFLICPKASRSEKNEGLENSNLPERVVSGETTDFGKMGINTPEMREKRGVTTELPKYKNFHPTVKPVKLMSYLITLGSRANDTILDPFMGSGTTGVASKQLCRDFIGIELNAEYIDIAKKRIENVQEPMI